MSHPVAALLEQLRNVFAREELPPAPAEVTTRRERPGLASLLFRIEELPLDPEPARPGRERSKLSLLFAPDPLPLDPERPSPRRGRWLAWLFRPERIDHHDDPPEVN